MFRIEENHPKSDPSWVFSPDQAYSKELSLVPNPTTRIIKPLDALASITDVVRGTSTRFWLQTMVMTGEPEQQPLIQELAAAARRGVDVRISVDAFNKYLLTGERHVVIPRWKRTVTEAEREQDERLKAMDSYLGENGVKIYTTNPISPLRATAIWTGRDHSKFFVADDNTSEMQEYNLHGGNLGALNFALRMDSPQANEILAQYFLLISNPNKRLRYYDYVHRLNQDNTFIFDGGRNFESLIMKIGLLLIGNEAEEVIWPNAFPPSGSTARTLLEGAAKGTNIKVILSGGLDELVNHWLQRRKLEQFKQEADKYPNLEIYRPKDGRSVHGKSIYTPDRVLITTNNLNPEGPIAGTGENALLSTDPILIKQVKSYYEEELAKCERVC